MKSLNWKSVAFVLVAAVVLLVVHEPCRADSLSAEELISAIAASEEAIENLQATYEIYLSDKDNALHGQYEWAYEKGKEYLKGGTRYLDPKTKEVKYLEGEFAFDGERLRTLNPQKLYGTVRARKNDFNLRRPPAYFLGWYLDPSQPTTLSQILRTAERVSISSQMQDVEGRKTHLVEAERCYINYLHRSDVPINLKVWIDPERDFRPIRLEKYKFYLGELGAEFEKPLLQLVLRGVNLKKVNGVWVPVEGYAKVFFLLGFEGFPAEELAKKSVDEIKEIVAQAKPILGAIEGGVGTKHMKVKEIKVNEPIPPNKFVLKFPVGSAIWDDFLKKTYRIGPNGEVLKEE